MSDTTTLIILDGQNDFLSPEGALYDGVKDGLKANNVVDNINLAIKAARQSGTKIINTVVSFSPGYPEAGNAPYGIFASVGASGGFIKGTWGSESAETLDIEESDTVLEKAGMSIFLNPETDNILKTNGTETLVLAGLLTDACVEGSMREAYEKGYEVIALTDAMTTLSIEKHQATVDNSFPMFSKPMTTNDFIKSS